MKTGKRVKYTDAARRALMAVFEYNKYPSTSERKQLADAFNMSTRNIQVWFQNQRQRRPSHKHKIRVVDVNKDDFDLGGNQHGHELDALSIANVDMTNVIEQLSVFYEYINNTLSVEQANLVKRTVNATLYPRDNLLQEYTNIHGLLLLARFLFVPYCATE